MSGVDDPIVPALVSVGAWADGVCAGGGGDVSLPLSDGVAGGAVVVGADAVAVRRAESICDPFVFSRRLVVG